MIRAKALIGFVTFAILGTVQAGELRLSPGEIENLGIRFEQPSPAHDASGIEATARVVLPAAGDTVISALLSGVLTSLTASVGEEVVKGQVLAELKSPEFLGLQREFLDAVSAQRLAQTEHDRDAELHAEGIISARRLQETTMRKAIADAALDEHRQLLLFAGMRDADIRSLESRQQLQGSLAIRAPFSGVIAARLASTGERLDDMSPIYRLIDTSELWLDINVPQEQLAIIGTGASVEAAASPTTWKAAVTSIGRAIDPSTQSAIVRARLEQGAEGLRPGQLLAVRVVSGDPDTAASDIYQVPAAAITRSNNVSYVFVRNANGVVVTQVEVVSVTGGNAFIRGDIDMHDSVATSGVSALKSMWLADSEQES